MKLQLILFCCLLGVTHSRLVKRIFGGRDAERSEFPNMASLQGYIKDPSTSAVFCQGFIYNFKWIMITGRCALLIDTIYPRRNVRVHVGRVHLIKKTRFEQTRFIIGVYRHGENEESPQGRFVDLGLLKLNRGLKLDQYVKAFPISRNLTYPEGSALIVGWGCSNTTDLVNIRLSYNLQVADVKILTFEECQDAVKFLFQSLEDEFLEKSFNNNHFCSGSFQSLNGPALGDSGGPVMQKNAETGGYDVVGIISAALAPPGYPSPTLHVHIAPFVEWIELTMRQS